MKIETLKLYGHDFAVCVSLNESFRISNEMRNDSCFAYILEGTQEIFSQSGRIIAKNSESILMKCGNYISNFENDKDSTSFKSIVIHLDPEIIQKVLGNQKHILDSVQNSLNKTTLKIEQNDLLDNFIQSLYPYFETPTLINDVILENKLRELILILSDSGQNTINTQILSSLYTPEQFEFNKVIEANILNKLTIKELSHLTFRSESTFKRDFRKYFNESPAKYIKRKRLEKASELLRNSCQSISEIAWKCGFENIAHFSTSFVKIFNEPPRSYRNDLNRKVLDL